ncbi:MAG: lipid-A-disaccharide synthase [Ignavibacteria bacterium]|nr:lipid-A-disaccharide synthase [Ignavibacteria bacterium]
MENILIIAGEVSGDQHGSKLSAEILKLNHDVKLFGIGGDNMKDAGVELLYHIKDLSFLGFIEVIKHIPFLRRIKKELLEHLQKRNVKKIILIDYPGFNLSFAKDAYNHNRKIFYYISPQIWAWGKKRISKIKKYIHKVLVILPFEKKFYEENNVNVDFVGHPLIESIADYNFESKEMFFQTNNLQLGKKLVVIFPGSRLQEINRILPTCIEAVEVLKKELPIQVAISAVNNIPIENYEKYISNSDVKIIYNKNYELLKYADAGIIKSGTSALEAILFDLPFFVIYKTSYINYLIGKLLINIDTISLANIIAEKKFLKELIQRQASVTNVAIELKRILLDDKYVDDLKKNYAFVRNALGDKGASVKSARIILELN